MRRFPLRLAGLTFDIVGLAARLVDLGLPPGGLPSLLQQLLLPTLVPLSLSPLFPTSLCFPKVCVPKVTHEHSPFRVVTVEADLVAQRSGSGVGRAVWVVGSDYKCNG